MKFNIIKILYLNIAGFSRSPPPVLKSAQSRRFFFFLFYIFINCLAEQEKHFKRVNSEISEGFLTAQVAFLRQGNAQVAVPPTKAVSQEGREGEGAVGAEPLLGDGGGHGSTTWPERFLFIYGS